MSASACPKCGRALVPGDVFCPTCGTPNPERSADAGAAATAMLPQDDLQKKLQKAVGPDYVVEHMIGEGGFALVFAVTDRKLQRRIALKVLRPEFTAAKGSIQRFIREAESAAKINHPHILPIFFVGEGEGLVYFAMPLVDGETLDTRLRREGQLPEDEVIRLGTEIADALAEAHGHGLVHRDIKPQNVMLSGQKKRALVMDFGIAKAAAGSGEKLTGTGVIIGSPHYMSPEQAGGDPGVDQRSDIYSLGIVLWEMLAGEVPFDGPSTQGILIQHLTQSVPSIRARRPSVSAALANVVSKATAKKVDDRFQTAHELSEALKLASQGGGRRSMAIHVPKPVVAGLGAAVLVVAVAGFFAWRHFAHAAEQGAHALPPPAGVKVAALPFEELNAGDATQFGRTSVRLMTDALDKDHVPVVDDEELLGHWSQDGRKAEDPLETKAAFAAEHGASQMVIGNAVASGRTLQLSADIYDTRDSKPIGSATVTGSSDSLFALIDHVAAQLSGVLCSQPGYNPGNRCFDVPARPATPISVTDEVKPGEAPPSPPAYAVLVDTSGQVADVRMKTPSSHDDVNAAAETLIRGARFTPAKKRGTVVNAWTDVDVAVHSETGAEAGASGCAEPAANQLHTCYDTAPATTQKLTTPWRGTGTPSAPNLWLLVGVDGTVHEIRVAAASNQPQFTEAAKRAAQRLHFTPAQKSGAAVAAWTRVSISKE